MNFVRVLLALTVMLFGAASVHAQAVPGQGTWESTLLGRDINLNPVAATSDAAVYLYDTTLNITWLRDANKNVGNGNGGQMDRTTAMAWASNLVTGSGANSVNGWRLPAMADPAASMNCTNGGTNCGQNVATSSSEMASLFFNTLGNKSYLGIDISGASQAGFGLTNAGSFQNMQSNFYWLGTEYAPIPNFAWIFNTAGAQYPIYYEDFQFYAMAVHSGDVAAVPEPETYAMLLAGLGLIGAVARRRQSDKSLVTKS